MASVPAAALMAVLALCRAPGMCVAAGAQPVNGGFPMVAVAKTRFSAHAAAPAIESSPAWWQTHCAVAAAVTLGAGAFAMLIWLASHRLLKRRLLHLMRRHSLELERTRIAHDLHDELGGRLAKIKLIAERLSNQVAGTAFQATADRLYRQAGRLSADLRDIIWTVNPDNDSWRSLADYISQYAHSHLSDTGIRCTPEGIETMPATPISPQIRHHVLAIAKETLNNVIKHAQADLIRIRFATDGQQIRLLMSDNGRGFDPAARNEDGNGLANMRARAAEIGASLDIASSPHTGTTTTLVLHSRLPSPARAGCRRTHANLRRHR